MRPRPDSVCHVRPAAPRASLSRRLTSPLCSSPRPYRYYNDESADLKYLDVKTGTMYPLGEFPYIINARCIDVHPISGDLYVASNGPVYLPPGFGPLYERA